MLVSWIAIAGSYLLRSLFLDQRPVLSMNGYVAFEAGQEQFRAGTVHLVTAIHL